jgi:hypothetical protein
MKRVAQPAVYCCAAVFRLPVSLRSTCSGDVTTQLYISVTACALSCCWLRLTLISWMKRGSVVLYTLQKTPRCHWNLFHGVCKGIPWPLKWPNNLSSLKRTLLYCLNLVSYWEIRARVPAASTAKFRQTHLYIFVGIHLLKSPKI